MSGTSGDDGGSGGLLRLLAVGDFVGVVLEILYGPRSGPAFAAVTNSSRAGVLGDADTAVGAALAHVRVAKTFWVRAFAQLARRPQDHSQDPSPPLVFVYNNRLSLGDVFVVPGGVQTPRTTWGLYHILNPLAKTHASGL